MEKINSAPPLLEVRDLSVRFSATPGTLHAVDRLSFSLGKGEILALVGESGSGKTVSLMSLMGLIDSSNMSLSGEAFFQGHDLLKISAAEMAALRGRDIGFLFQNPLNCLNPVMKIGPQISEAPLHHGIIGREQAQEYAIDLLAQVGIPKPAERYNDYAHRFSGGERQRIMIAIAMSCGPKLLIADEPTTSLDVTIEKKILQLLLDLRKANDLSIVLITHNLNVAMNFADRIAVMYGGSLMELATPYDLLREPLHPYTRALFGANLEIGTEGRRNAKWHLAEGWPQGCQFVPAGSPESFRSRSMLELVPGSSDHWVSSFMRDLPDSKEQS